ncbi:MAG TPA: PPOX class F420-dependent oxidoreductase [Gaiellaceae bacterium]|nr:PPOX class F420-dependent oxidoreductase [Gaiellaceae bacterium]
MPKLDEAQAAFLRNPYYAVISTIRPDGTSHQTVVWVDTDGGDILVNTAEGRAKPRHMRENPNVSIAVLDPSNGYHWLAASGKAELSHEGADAHIDKLAKKYLDADSYPFRKEGEVRVIVRIRPERIETAGFDGEH